MAEIIPMPKLGFDMQEGTLVRWMINEGESVKKGQVLAEIETDKATVEVESSHDGVLLNHLVEADSIVPIGDPIAVIGKKGEKFDLASLKGKSESEDTQKEAAQNKKVEEKDQSAAKPSETMSQPHDGDERIKASPLARKMAADSDLDLAELVGSGPDGRIIKKDIELALKAESESIEARIPAKQLEPVMKPQPESIGVALPLSTWQSSSEVQRDKTIQLSRLRQAIGRRMTESKQQTPHFYATYAYDVESLMELRSEVNRTLLDEQKLSVNDFVVKAVAVTLKQFPNLNAALQDKEVIQYGAVNIGVAVAVEGGLLTVVVRDADLKPIRMISSEVKEMAGRVRSGKVKVEDIEGSTFSISNLGMFGVQEFSAIINPPEAAILAVSAAKKMPVVKGDEIVVGWRMEVTISVDHRVSDGAEAAQFLKALAYQLENPIRLLL
ncbi:MAG: hypothetical protein BGO78_04645 [Chloroflexi bacterium 44-23]|nr:MAG: hypothetical protein BGO78_04645 [Chloroflexi bacterium 44-23]